MCGRYTLFTDPEYAEIQAILQKLSQKYPDRAVSTGEIFPTQTAPVLTASEGSIEAEPFIWGFPGFRGSRPLINARCETVLEKKTFRDSFINRRCAVPSTGFYEWSPQKQKVLFTLPAPVTYLAGIYTKTDGPGRFVILTAPANPSVRKVHGRMPVILTPDILADWIMDDQTASAYLHESMPELEAHFL